MPEESDERRLSNLGIPTNLTLEEEEEWLIEVGKKLKAKLEKSIEEEAARREKETREGENREVHGPTTLPTPLNVTTNPDPAPGLFARLWKRLRSQNER